MSMALISTSNGYSLNGNVIVESNFMIKIVMIFAMMFGSLSINLHYKSFAHGVSSYFKNKNMKYAFTFLLGITLFISTCILNNIKIPFIEKFVDTCFLIVSFISTTGLIPNHFYDYQVLGNMILFLGILSLIGGSVSSTTGGLKPTRIIYIYKYISIELFRLGNPRKIKAKEKLNSIDETSQIFIFCILYLISIPILSSILSLYDIKFEEAFFIVIMALTNTGVGLIETANINYYPNSMMEIILLSIVMLCGRIEIFLVMILLSSFFWKNN
jgi:trk system potassium uptake protein TrkH